MIRIDVPATSANLGAGFDSLGIALTMQNRVWMEESDSLEITCTDSCECFDTNKNYIKGRIENEQNEKVRKILNKDLNFLDSIQTETSTARQFLFTARCKSSKSENILQKANRVEKIISDQGFEVTRMKKADIKRFLAIYFEASMNGDLMPDYDGEQYISEVENEEV